MTKEIAGIKARMPDWECEAAGIRHVTKDALLFRKVSLPRPHRI
jgi:hypothetical protein